MPAPATSSNDTYNRDFADYYDRITQHKDYDAEIEALDRFIADRFGARQPKLLDVGCGTGNHATLLAARGYDVTAIDLSPDMIRVALAKDSKARFHSGDVGNLPAGGFDLAYSLFNVVNCLASLDQLIGFLTKVAAQLRDGGTLLFESWNPIAVVAAPPEIVERTYECGEEKIVRKVTPTPDFLRQRLDLEYEIDVYRRSESRAAKHFVVRHRLTLFTPFEIEFCVKRAGFGNVRLYTALPDLGEAKPDDRMLAFACEKVS